MARLVVRLGHMVLLVLEHLVLQYVIKDTELR